MREIRALLEPAAVRWKKTGEEEEEEDREKE